MRILYFSQFFYPERVAAAFRSFENSILWKESGCSVTVFTAYPNFPTGVLFDGYETKLMTEELIDDIRVLRSKIIIRENKNKIDRILNAFSFLFFGLINIVLNKDKIGKNYDIVLGTSGTLLTPVIAYIYSRLNRIPFILELRDLTYKQILAVYSNKKNILYYLVKFIELFLCKKASKIVVVTEGFKQDLIKEGIPAHKIEIIMNGVNLNKIKNESIMISTENKSRELVFSYMGNLGSSQNLIEVIRIFNNINITDYDKKLIIIGDGAEKRNIIEYIQRNNISNVLLLDGMSQEKLEEFYKISDFCIVSLNNNIHFQHTIPSKIFQIMARKKNILFFGPEGEASEIISKVDENYIFTSTNIEQIIKELNHKLNSIDDLESYLKNTGEKYYQLVKNSYDRVYLAQKFLNLMTSIRRK